MNNSSIHNYFELFYNNSNMLVAIISNSMTLVSANKSMLDFAQIELDDIIGTVHYELPWWRHSLELQEKIVFAMEHAFCGETARFAATHIDYKGVLHEIDFILKPIINNGEVELVIAMGYNISDLIATQKALTRREKEIQAFFDNSDDGYFFYMLLNPVSVDNVDNEYVNKILENQSLRSHNNRLVELTGIDDFGKTNVLSSIGIENSQITDLWLKMIRDGRVTIDTVITNCVTGANKTFSVTLVSILDDQNLFTGNFCIVRDKTMETEFINKLSYIATTDVLTGLNNRRQFYELSEVMFNDTICKNSNTCIAMLDIDHFKNVNDVYGHDIGDKTIAKFAELIKSELRPDFVAGRYGGEEFVIIMPIGVEETAQVIENIRLKVQALCLETPKGKLKFTVSAGIAAIEKEMRSIDEPIKNADLALYESKTCGRNRLTVFINEIHGKSAFDPITGVLKEKSLLYKINKMIDDANNESERFTVFSFNLKVLTELNEKQLNRHLSTLALCMNTALRKSDILGRYNDTCIIAALPATSKKQANELINRIIVNLRLGFNQLIGDELDIMLSVTEFNHMNTTFLSIMEDLMSSTKPIIFS